MPDINNQQKYYIRDTTDSQDTLQMGVCGHHPINIFQNLNKMYYVFVGKFSLNPGKVHFEGFVHLLR